MHSIFYGLVSSGECYMLSLLRDSIKKHACLLTGWPKITAACHYLLAWGMSRRQAYCVHTCTVYTLLVDKAAVAPDVTLRFTVCKQVRVQVREPPWPWGGSYKVQNRSNQWPHKMNLDLTKNSWWSGMGHVGVKMSCAEIFFVKSTENRSFKKFQGKIESP